MSKFWTFGWLVIYHLGELNYYFLRERRATPMAYGAMGFDAHVI